MAGKRLRRFSPTRIRPGEAAELNSSRNFDSLVPLLNGYAEEIETRAAGLDALASKMGGAIPPAILGAGKIYDVRAFGTLAKAITYIGGDIATLYITNEQAVTTNTTIPSNISIVVLKGGSFAISTGVTLTIQGPLEAGNYQIFSGLGTADILPGSVAAFRVQWWGAFGNGALAVDDTVALKAAFAAVGAYGGILIFEKAVSYFLISSTNTSSIGLETGDGFVHVIGKSTKIKQAATTSPYTMFRFRSNMIIEGIELEGYIDSGTGDADVVPQSGYGFRTKRIGGSADGVLFLNCISHDCSFDGWYVAPENGGGHVVLRNCSGYDCYRNDFAAVGTEYIEVDGGTWGNDSSVINKNAAIDFEPDFDTSIGKAVAKNLKSYHKVSFAADNGEAFSGHADNIEFDGTIYGTACGLAVGNFNVMRIGYIRHHSNARYFLINAAAYTTGQSYGGRLIVDRREQAQAPNLIPYTCGVTAGWTQYFVSGAATKTDGVLIGSHRTGFRLENSGGGYNYLRMRITSFTVGLIYSFGCVIRGELFENNYHGMWIRCNDAVGNEDFYNRPTRIENTEKIGGALRIPTGTTSIDLFLGSDANTDPYDITYSDVYFCEGIVDNESVQSFGTPISTEALITADGGIQIGFADAGDSRLYRDVDFGLIAQGIAGVDYDYGVLGPAGAYAVMANPTGTPDMKFFGKADVYGDLVMFLAGSGIQIKEGSNARMGVSTLVAGVVTVSNTSITANTRVFTQRQSDGGTVGASYSITRIAGTSFTITSMDGAGAAQTADTSIIGWELKEPA